MALDPSPSHKVRFSEDPLPERRQARPIPGPDAPLQFSLETLLLVTTLIAVCLGVTMAVPPLGLIASFLAAGAFIRTLFVARQFQQQGLPFGIGEKITAFIISFGVVMGAVALGLMTLLALIWLGVVAVKVAYELADASSNLLSVIFSILGGFYFLAVIWGPIWIVAWFLWATRPREPSVTAR